MSEPLLRLSQVSKYYTGNQAVVVGLNGVSLEFSRGEFVAITGESGSGKSTLSHVIGGILPYESGELYFNGKETSHFDSLDWERYRRDNISFISQNYGILPGATVLKNVVSALVLAGMDKPTAKTEAEKILKQVELWELKHRRAAKLSSGQKQRLSIARALAKPAPILIADEPTGNLDPENSEKVISLLKQASADRLVILITHEFDEAKDAATRHIVLQDGRVASDTELSAAPEPAPAPSVKSAKKRLLSPYVAQLQYSSRPVWTAFMVLFFAMTAFAVFAFLGVFVVSLDDTPTRIFDNSAFRNGDTKRIAVMRGDTEAFTEEDYDKILSLKHVTAIEPNGYVTDTQYAYRNDVDYKTVYTEVKYFDEETMFKDFYMQEAYQMYADAPFVKTVPILKNGEAFLTDGRLPENFYEIVSADPEHNVGDTVRVFLSDQKNWAVANKIEVIMTVVGRTDIGEGLYFHDDVGYFFRGSLKANGSQAFYQPVIDLEEGYFRGNALIYTRNRAIINVVTDFKSTAKAMISSNTEKVNGETVITYETWGFILPSANRFTVTFTDENGTLHTGESNHKILTLAGYFASPVPEEGELRTVKYYPRYLAEVSFEDFYSMTDTSPSDQISITIDRYAYADRVIEELQSLGYAAVSPYKLGSTRQDPDLAAERTQTLRVCLIALIAIIALQTVLLRAMFGMQTESYRLLSNIGLRGVTAKLSIVWQMVVFTVAGQILGALGIIICAQAGIERIREILSYLPPIYILLLSGVHIAASAVSTVWIVTALGRQVYPLSGKYEDIILDDGGKGD